MKYYVRKQFTRKYFIIDRLTGEIHETCTTKLRADNFCAQLNANEAMKTRELFALKGLRLVAS